MTKKTRHKWEWEYGYGAGRATCKLCGMKRKLPNKAETKRHGESVDMMKRPGGKWKPFSSPPPCPGNSPESMKAAALYMFHEAVVEGVRNADEGTLQAIAGVLGYATTTAEAYAKAAGLPWPKEEGE